MQLTEWRDSLLQRLQAEREQCVALLDKSRDNPECTDTLDFDFDYKDWILTVKWAMNFGFDGQANDFLQSLGSQDPDFPGLDWEDDLPPTQNRVDHLRLALRLLDKWTDKFIAMVDAEEAKHLTVLQYLVTHGGTTQLAIQTDCQIETPVFRALFEFFTREGIVEVVSGSRIIRATDAGLIYHARLLERKQTVTIPPEIQSSLANFRKDHPDPRKVGFIIMRFGTTKAHEQLLASIRSTLALHGLEGLRADDKQYHDDLFHNIMTYMYGCGFGIAVYERIETEQFNPNVSLEVGGMIVMAKPVCFLKDKTLQTLNTDLVGRLYKAFDPQDPKPTIERELSKWLKDKGLV